MRALPITEELYELRAEVAVARERLGPAGYKIIQEVALGRKLISAVKVLQAINDSASIHPDNQPDWHEAKDDVLDALREYNLSMDILWDHHAR